MKSQKLNVLRILASFALVITVVSCSDDTDEATQKYQTAKALSDALLTVTDMPAGWEESQRQVFEKRENENPSLDPSVWCPAAQTTAEPLIELAGDSGADVEMNMNRGGGQGSSLMRLQAWSNEDVEEYFSTAAIAAEKCDGAKTTDESGVVTALSLITNRTLGDESVSWSERLDPPASTQDEKMSTIGRTTIARFGNVIMVLQIGDAAPTDSLTLMDESQWWDIVSLAGEKLAKVND